MKKFIFKIEKIITEEIEVEAKDNKHAIHKLAGYISQQDPEFCEKILVNETKHRCFLREIKNGKKRFLFDEDDDINDNIIAYMKFTEDGFEEKITPREHIEVCCDKCGNCIPIDEYIHQFES